MAKPNDALTNRLTHSLYYGGNVGKGGVFIQLCGWLGTHELWCGAVSDTFYLSNSGILEEQERFVKQDATSQIPFTNVTDKGYRCTMAAWRRGQFLLQPIFARADVRFNTQEVIISAAIATDRSGNERAVNVCKRSNLIKRGLQHSQKLRA
jgi:hypothetical protein